MTPPPLCARGGIDYPRNRAEFDDFFPDEQTCLRYLEKLRWLKGFVCPRCGRPGTPWRSSRGMLICPRCRRHASVLAGTLFHRTRTPLRAWLLAAWEITSRSYGANALALQRGLGLGSYQTAWAWLHKFRRAMVHPGHDRLSGSVEADESTLGDGRGGLSGRQNLKGAIVAIAVESNGGKIGRVRLRCVPDLSATSLVGFLTSAVVPGSTVSTDGWCGYEGLADCGIDHRVRPLPPSPDPSHVVMPSVRRVASLLRRWILGTLQGGIAREHLPYYLDEFTFRFNRRNSRARGLLFYHLLEQAVRSGHTPTARLYKGTGRGPRRIEGRERDRALAS